MTSTSSPDDIVIVGAFRTPIGKAKKGQFSKTKNDYLVSEVIKGTFNKLNISPSLIDEVVFGHCLSPLNGTVSLRIGALRAGLNKSTPMSTVNRQCASGLESMSVLYNKLKLDQIEVGLGGGFESMSMYSFDIHECISSVDPIECKNCTLPMGETAEILATKHNIPRSKCDVYAFKSHNRAIESQRAGKFESEIIEVRINRVIIDNETRLSENNMTRAYNNGINNDLNKTKIISTNMIVTNPNSPYTVSQDDCLRPTTLTGLKSLKSVFRDSGVCTAGNSSQLADNASTVLMMKRKKAKSLNLEIKGVMIDYVVVGIEPSIMGEGPVPAIKLLLNRNNLRVKDIAYFEINEAFAPQVIYCIEELGIDHNKVNVYGGSIALGHPLGSTGTRLVCTLLNVMEKEKIEGYGVVSLCVGTGMGVALLVKR